MNYIIDPKTNEEIDLNTKKGLFLLKKYVTVYNETQKGGVNFGFLRSLVPWSSMRGRL